MLIDPFAHYREQTVHSGKAGFQIPRTHFARATFGNARVWNDGDWVVFTKLPSPQPFQNQFPQEKFLHPF
jgi:hypothetical protein